MSLHHAISGERIRIHPPAENLPDSQSVALLKSEQLEVMRLVLAAGRTVPPHDVPGEITLQCLDGAVEVQAHGKTETLNAGEMLFLAGGISYSLHAPRDAVVLMTVVLTRDDSGKLLS
ncbi:hypothetical protein SAMN06265795_101402 [Noviherbaspirillum humi]|uniref:Cupin domain-containing protein n=1 Tax=Noviherbaspirillum humi TaxID=1688639 RepID=A0A239CFL8_9BURK|nr:hypothetical protein [Noviherbaspirillum humi]SNS18254.1 hypothetical protein SAMN06265795_101402 [Noviherbaspirillum humi]